MLLLVCALSAPVFAKAITVDELKAQIASLQAQIAQLIAQLAQMQGGTTPWCHTFNTNLGMGASGAEVNALHIALPKSGFGNDDWSHDNFDEGTASLVVGFQEKYASEILKPYGLAHGTGYVGKSTRAKLNKLYGCDQITLPQPVKSITVSSPVAGQTVKSPVTISGKAVAFEGQFNIRIKDNNGVVLLDINTMGASSYGDPQPFSGQFAYNPPTAQSGTVEVFDISMKDGSETSKVTVPVAFGDYQGKNTCTDSDGGKNYYQKGTATESGKTYTDYCQGAFYLKEYFCLPSGSGGGGVAEENVVCPNNGTCRDGACIITSTENLPPVIDGVTAPTQLKVNEQGTWIIKAHDPENGSLTYSVDWGDSSTGGGGGVLAPTALREGIQTSTFTHSYSKAGTYTVTFTITDDKLKSVKTSTTVNITEQLETFSWNLEKGNNMISFPIKPTSDKIVDILKPIEGKYYSVSLWDEIGKKWLVFSATSSDFTLIEFNKSYDIKMKELATLTIQGTKWNKTLTEWMNSFNFITGWNSLGYPFTETMPMQSFSVSKPLQNILDYSPSESIFTAAYWKLYLTAHSAVTVPDSQKTTLFIPGKGYMASFYDCSITPEGFANICKNLCAEGYTSKCNADGSNISYAKGECYCAGL